MVSIVWTCGHRGFVPGGRALSLDPAGDAIDTCVSGRAIRRVMVTRGYQELER